MSTQYGFAQSARKRLISSAVFFAFASVRLTDATRAPSFARRRAIACPIPRPAPVTTATWFSNLIRIERYAPRGWRTTFKERDFQLSHFVGTARCAVRGRRSAASLPRKHAQERDLDGERFLDVTAEVIAQ